VIFYPCFIKTTPQINKEFWGEKLMEIEKYIDHTILKPEAAQKDVEKICREAIQYGFFAVCVNPCRVAFAANILRDSGVKLAAVVGFPLGANTTDAKLFETKKALSDGADEIDMVINIGRLKDGDTAFVQEEIKKLKAECGEKNLKVIVETCLLSEEEKKSVCHAVINGGADFIKTSTGFSTAGAQIEDVRLFASIAQGKIKIKASGGIGDYETAVKMIEAGANRLGTSRSIAIVEKKAPVKSGY
jgi:deoxyribose-phosphate aldolase